MKIGDKTIFAEIICSFLQYKNPSSTDLDDVLLAEVHQQIKIVHQLRQLKVGLPLLLEGGQGEYVSGSTLWKIEEKFRTNGQKFTFLIKNFLHVPLFL